jgi:protein SCO1/2
MKKIRPSLIAGPVALLLGAMGLGVGFFAFKPNVPIVQTSSLVGGPFRLTDQAGQTVTDAGLRGKPFLVFFGFTHCPDICPTKLFEISQALKAMGRDAENISALFVTVDPERDTPDVLARYLSNFSPRIRGLTGDQAAVDQMVKAYRAYAKKVPLDDGSYTMDHTAVVYVMDRDGGFVTPLNMDRPEADIAAELRRLV